ncbi:hypothetical protein D8B26_003112 [Coccidioides posadasii str. Silveira]|uniref:Uncharacterized protein n=3 Tax=Coccidioides posadasii TaxID=199306 RepID=E9CZ80_COCPS|nr:hypothetical protein CPC735_006760 [Coccidioides posadasii C735 delta SOWgp]EER26504.1 hypothetical protein CPC735_006760 [Coccidioides posadasii C735 delta SOWgp]EFW20524.1 conserved hypothetical protein [Coccidioides posadasii str. Silveira]KMM72910.1 hypothetical protein CPAG_09200 [Coccidioides posadasii RMSCC 3488]QVM08421.1 hypothetical protein D8B26_003112 [Coccidioides posadasii str. Silveira]|eukprot:XP_003068649.1 hypothetical protein CPC735_006760 [Coccidioides posadasii C735 delta SOWgp]
MRQQISPILASLANVFRIPLRPSVQALVNHTCREALAQDCYRSKVLQSSRSFTSSAPLEKKGRAKADKRITLIRYFLYHPLTPRPLRFSRDRYLRHWTIHRAWNLYQAKRRAARDLELERMYTSMRNACEELRTGVGDGGYLFRVSMHKKGVFTDGVPIEYGRLQTETPSREGWNYEWKR